jgi:hypothetical protein
MTHQSSPLSLTPIQTLALQQASSLLQGSESNITSGIRHLGIPIGSTLFADSFLDNAASTFVTTLHKLSHHIHDRQTMAALYQHCVIPSLSHLLAPLMSTQPLCLALPFCLQNTTSQQQLPYDSHQPTPTISTHSDPSKNSDPSRRYWLL